MVLRIDGPGVAIAAPLPPAKVQLLRRAEEFVAQVNEISNEVVESPPAPAMQSAPEPPETTDQRIDSSVPAAAGAREADMVAMDLLIAQLERLGKLRDSGVLTEDEFQEQKTALLRSVHDR